MKIVSRFAFLSSQNLHDCLIYYLVCDFRFISAMESSLFVIQVLQYVIQIQRRLKRIILPPLDQVMVEINQTLY